MMVTVGVKGMKGHEKYNQGCIVTLLKKVNKFPYFTLFVLKLTHFFAINYLFILND